MPEQKEVPLPILFYVIKIILYIIGFIIILITFLSIINYIFYTFYYIKEIIITNENLYNVYNLKFTDFINYKLLNYIKELNNTNDKKFNVTSDSSICYDIKNLKINYINIDLADTDVKLLSYLPRLSFEFDGFKDKLEKEYSKNKEYSIQEIQDMTKKIMDKNKNIEIDFNSLNDIDIKLLHSSVSEIVYGRCILKIEEKNYSLYFSVIANKVSNEQCAFAKNVLQSINSSLYQDIKVHLDNKKIELGEKINKEQDKKKKKELEEKGKNQNDIIIENENGIFNILSLKPKNNSNDVDMFGDVFGYVLNRLYILFPNNLYYSYDKSSNLYILTNNKLYELIFALIFIIFLIIAITITLDIAKNVIEQQSFLNVIEQQSFLPKILITSIKNYETISFDLINKPEYYYLIIIPIIITIYCIIHGIIYYYFFIKGTYKEILELYHKLTIPDELIRNEIIKYFSPTKNNIEDKEEQLLLLFEYISYGGEIDFKSGKYSVINTYDDDEDLLLKKFEEKMLQINKFFSYESYNYNENIYTKYFFDNIKVLYKKLGVNDEHKQSIIIILCIYIYMMEWNRKDPYLLIKLNKIIFGRVANIQNIKIDEDIENTLSLRTLLPHNAYDDGKYFMPDINNICDNVCKYLSDIPSGINSIKETLKKFVDKFVDNLIVIEDIKKKNNKNNYFNLYLALEMGLNILVILITLIIIKLYNSKSEENSELEKNIEYAKLFTSWIFTQITLSFFGIINVLKFV